MPTRIQKTFIGMIATLCVATVVISLLPKFMRVVRATSQEIAMADQGTSAHAKSDDNAAPDVPTRLSATLDGSRLVVSLTAPDDCVRVTTAGANIDVVDDNVNRVVF